MNSTLSYTHLEDLLPAWRAEVAPLLPQAGKVGIVLGKATAPDDLGATRFLVEQLTPHCLAWLQAQGYWPNAEADINRVQQEVQSAVQQLPLTPAAVVEETEIPPHRWAYPAAVGAGLGALLTAPLTWLSLGDRQIGLLIGAVAGAFALVSLLAFLAQRPRLYSIVQMAVLAGTGILAIGGLWQIIRGKSWGMLRSSLYLAALWGVMILLRPRRRVLSATERQLREQALFQEQLAHGTDLVLAFAWSHPDRVGDIESAPVSTAPLAPAICHLLSDLHVEVASGRDLHDLQDSVEALFQQFHDDGYEWRTIPQGTEFDETLRAEFDTYGLVKPGEPIFTRRAALRRQGQLLQKGELRRVRSG